MMERGQSAAAVAPRWCLAAVLAGIAVGAGDALLAWPDLAQFSQSVAGRLRTAAFVACLYGLFAGAAAAVIATSLSLVVRHTALGALLATMSRANRANRDRGPANRLTGASVALAALLVTPATLASIFLLAYPNLSQRKHVGLVIGVSMALAVLGLAAAALLTFVFGRLVEIALRAAARRKPIVASWLGSPVVLAWLCAALATASAAIAASQGWSTVRHLGLRPAFAMWACLLATFALAPVATLCRARLVRLGRARVFAAPVGAALLAAIVLSAGASSPVRKGADAYTGLGGALTVALHRIFDFDRDGHSSILGGGDCDDLDDEVYPGVVDFPNDGIDQNCIGGDADARELEGQPAFHERPASVPEDLSIVLITIDTLRSDHVGTYGYARDTTPNIDKVAAEGAVFVNAWAHAPSTRYSMPAILTGRYPLSVFYDFSVRGWPGLLDAGDFLGKLMKSSGRRTGAILNYWYFDRSRSMNRGFDTYDNGNASLHKGLPGQGPAKTTGSSSRQQTDKAIKFLQQSKGQPFFLWVHYYDPHSTYERHPESTDFGSTEIDLYDNEIHYTDKHIGRLIDALKHEGLYDRTALVITGDHGEGFGEHGVFMHGYHLYAAQTRVPLIFRVPGMEPSRPSSPAGHIDILPTLANLVGAKSTRDMQGHSLLGILSGSEDRDADRWIYQQLSFENNNEMRAAASKQCHVVFRVSPTTSWELYRIDRDPLEQRDVISDPGPCRQARSQLERWYDRSQIPSGALDALVPPTDQPTSSLGVTFGDSVELIAVKAPAAVERGQTIAIEYTFNSLGPAHRAWRFFVHVEGDRGTRFSDDHGPVRPFSWWKAGQYIRYTRHVRIPATAKPGRYRIWMGVFDKAGRLSAKSHLTEVRDDRAMAATFVVN